MEFCDMIEKNLGYKVGIYNISGKLIQGSDVGFCNVADRSFDEINTYLRFKEYIISINSNLSKDACNLVRLTYNLILEKNFSDSQQSLEYIFKNDVSPDTIKGRYKGYCVFYIVSNNSILDILRSIYEGQTVELVDDGNGVYLVKMSEDVELEADSIIGGIRQEKGLNTIIGCGRIVEGAYTIKDSAVHAKSAYSIAQKLNLKEGFYHIDKMLTYGIMDSVEEEKINFFMHGEYNSFFNIVRDNELINTAEQLLKCDLNISDAARKLYIHRNTLLYRIEKIKTLTELDIKKFEDAYIFKFIISLLKLGK